MSRRRSKRVRIGGWLLAGTLFAAIVAGLVFLAITYPVVALILVIVVLWPLLEMAGQTAFSPPGRYQPHGPHPDLRRGPNDHTSAGQPWP